MGEKKVYETPEVEVLGTIEDLTHGWGYFKWWKKGFVSPGETFS